MTYRVAVLIGSLRKESFTRKTANAIIALAPDTLEMHVVEIGALALYNQDLEAHPPAAWTAFRTEMHAMNAVLFATPEYNRSVPAVLKNALDVGSRPYGHSVFNEKPAAVVSVSPGALGAFGANHHLRQSLVFLNMPTMQMPEAYVGDASNLFNKEGKLENDSTSAFLQKFILTFAWWIERNAAR